MTYLQFHYVFTIPVFILLLARRTFSDRRAPRSHWIATLLLSAVAILYTIPWDSYLIREGIWEYPAESVIGTLFSIPWEEIFFMAVQTNIACLWTEALIYQHAGPKNLGTSRSATVGYAVLVISSLVAFGLALNQAFSIGPNRYLSLIVVWCLPVLLLQWSCGWFYLLSVGRYALLTVASLTAYLWLCDWIAIHLGVWSFASQQTTQIFLFGHLPIEEALFFLVTNVMVVQGYLLFQGLPTDRIRFLGVTR